MNKHNLGEYAYLFQASNKQIQDDQLDLYTTFFWVPPHCDHIYMLEDYRVNSDRKGMEDGVSPIQYIDKLPLHFYIKQNSQMFYPTLRPCLVKPPDCW